VPPGGSNGKNIEGPAEECLLGDLVSDRTEGSAEECPLADLMGDLPRDLLRDPSLEI
jgi:hypothetical protein